MQRVFNISESRFEGLPLHADVTIFDYNCLIGIVA